ncbi:VOC family protein [Marivita hallyeonensis]|uniref:Glyoxalase/Bleomycin resistance protein/Dioxygenase superfamily protein n=1 Tax=Marivita hallyeonensis TaxID=996342 RepID=A0A1M5XMQ7_9RHOB|nr:VOC family protein [Marivita hallyeonensis]SHI01135.1 Glyoxalase/Bleomycin resistance protein/Dioxygenase superfamily protein [Marivita hallyeonensis]
MSFFGQVRQLGYVVKDLEAAMTYWRDVMGVGPFFHFENAPVGDFKYYGVETDAKISLALANCGDMQIELIQPRDDKPSPYRDFLNEGREGLQHLAFWSETFDADLAHAQTAGFKVILSGYAVQEDGLFAYFDDTAAPQPGVMVELSALTGAKKETFAMIKEKSLTWDGKIPVQRMDAG